MLLDVHLATLKHHHQQQQQILQQIASHFARLVLQAQAAATSYLCLPYGRGCMVRVC
jgi:hypothetical protein